MIKPFLQGNNDKEISCDGAEELGYLFDEQTSHPEINA
jgi:hypothetical protein